MTEIHDLGLPANADEAWERPAPKFKGEPNAIPILLAIGEATVCWETLEEYLANLFRQFVESNSHAASRAFGAIASNRGRCEALENAAEVYFRIHDVAPNRRKEFKLLMKHLEKARGRRNEIVHAITMDVIPGDADETAGFFLIPPRYNSRRTAPFMNGGATKAFEFLGVAYWYTSEDIRHFAVRFRNLQQAVLRFHGKLAHEHPREAAPYGEIE